MDLRRARDPADRHHADRPDFDAVAAVTPASARSAVSRSLVPDVSARAASLTVGQRPRRVRSGRLRVHNARLRVRLEVVIMGPDLVWRDNGWVLLRSANKDPDFRDAYVGR